MKFCKYCGVQIKDGALFCPKCGKKQEQTVPINNKVQASIQTDNSVPLSNNVSSSHIQYASMNNPQSSKMPYVLISIMAAIIIAGGAYFIFAGSKANAPKGKTEIVTQQATKYTSSKALVKAGKVMILSPEQQKNMDVFFSNFAEVWGNPPQGGKVAFDYDGISNKDLITFGVYHNLINRQTVVQLVNGKYMVPLKEVNFATNKYLGKTVAPEAVDTRFTTDGDNFYSMENGGPAFWSAAKLKQMYDNGDGTFSADVYVYASSDRNNDYSNGKLWKAVLVVSPSDSSRYILKSWKRGW